VPESERPDQEPPRLDLVIGARLYGRGPLRWLRADAPDLPAGAWVIVEQAGQARPALVAVGTGQCLQAPFDPATLPPILRRARPEELPAPPRTAGRRLLESLPLEGSPLEGSPLEGSPLEGSPLDSSPHDSSPLDSSPRER
jgi:hypothetical protein